MQTLKLDLTGLRFVLQSSCHAVTIILPRTGSDQSSKAVYRLQEFRFPSQ